MDAGNGPRTRDRLARRRRDHRHGAREHQLIGLTVYALTALTHALDAKVGSETSAPLVGEYDLT